MKEEKRDQIFYVRTTAKNKAWLHSRMKKDKFSSMSKWFDTWVYGLRKKGKRAGQ